MDTFSLLMARHLGSNRGIIKYEHGNDAMAFNTAETERLRLTSGGDLLVGHGSVISNMKYGGAR